MQRREEALGVRSDASCAIPWLADGCSAIQIFVDPSLHDRERDLCMAIQELSGAHRDIDTLTDDVIAYTDGEGLSAAIYPRPRDELSDGLVAVAITVG